MTAAAATSSPLISIQFGPAGGAAGVGSGAGAGSGVGVGTGAGAGAGTGAGAGAGAGVGVGSGVVGADSGAGAGAGLAKMPNTVKWLTLAVMVFVSGLTVVSRLTHFAPSQKAMTKSSFSTPAGNVVGSNAIDSVIGGSKVAPLGPNSLLKTIALLAGAGGTVAGSD